MIRHAVRIHLDSGTSIVVAQQDREQADETMAWAAENVLRPDPLERRKAWVLAADRVSAAGVVPEALAVVDARRVVAVEMVLVAEMD